MGRGHRADQSNERRHAILDRVQQGDPKAAEELLPLVYDELRRLAAHKMANEAPAKRCNPPRSSTKPGCGWAAVTRRRFRIAPISSARPPRRCAAS